ncbi:MAG: TonB-dependent receptor [Acidobacteria bacterium]|nr:TonB-dependent receptor [Acidobacteriota bacterium]
MFKILIRSAHTVLVMYSLWLAALAQGTTGSILGTVYDQSQAVLPGVTVTATEADTGQRREVLSDEQGRYTMAQMKIGRYVVEAELPGFQRASRGVTLTLQGDAVVNFTMAVGATQTEITVTSEAPLVETASSSVKGLVDQQQIRSLPLNGRSFTDLISLQAGVTVNYNQPNNPGAEGTKFSISGTRATQTSFQLDGTDIRNQLSFTPGSVAGVVLGVDTVQEFNVVTAVASAEYGGFTGGVVNAVTRSGTNDFHGTLFEFHRNSALDARNFFDRDPKNPLTRSNPPNFIRNQYGVTLGGPVQKDKLFFFGSFEGLNDRLTTTGTGFVPGLNARRGVFSTGGNVTPSPITKPILDTYPLPNERVLQDVADYVFANRRVVDEYYYMIKVDWQVSDKDSVAGRYTLDRATRQQSGNLDNVMVDSATRPQYLLLEWKRLFSSRLINEARVSLNRSRDLQNPVFLTSFPEVMRFNPLAFTFTGKPWYGEVGVQGLTNLGFPATQGRSNVLNRFQYIDNLSYASGAHSLRTGFNIQRLQLNYSTPILLAGSYVFRSLRDLVTAATPQTFSGNIQGSVPRGLRQVQMAFYAQDDWRVRPNLTLNMGLRYEPFTRPVEVAGRLSTFRRASDTFLTVGNPLFVPNLSYQNFAPRVGFAWDPFSDGKMSIRAGYGLFYELIQPTHYAFASPYNFPFGLRIALANPPFPNPRQGLPSDLSSIVTSPWGFSDDIRQGGVHQYQLSVQRQLLEDLVVQLIYTGSKGYNLGHMVDRNTAIPQRDPQGRYPFWPVGSVRRNAAFTEMRDFAWDASSLYNALAVVVRKRFSQGYSLQGSYTFSKSMDEGSSTGVVDNAGSTNGFSLFPEDIRVDRGLSWFDVRNRLVINGTWDLPFGRNRAIGNSWAGALQQILGGWSINGILTVSDGNRSTVALPFNRSNSQQTIDTVDRPNLIPGGNNNPVLSGGRDPNRYFDVFQFELGPPGYLGNLPRTTLENPGVLTLDFSISRSFSFTERRYVEFRAEMFNIANRANFSSPPSPAGVRIFTSATARNPNAARIVTTSTTSRQIQFALKMYF